VTYTFQDLDGVVRAHLHLGILNSNDLGKYHQEFLVILQYLVSKNRMSKLEQVWAFMHGFQPALDQQVQQQLQLK